MKKEIRFLHFVNASLILCSILFLSSCKKDAGSDTKKVEYKVIAAPKTISRVSYTDVSGNILTVSNINQNNWSSGTLNIPDTVTVLQVSASAMADQNITPPQKLTIQIYVNGTLKKEQTATATNNTILLLDVSY